MSFRGQQENWVIGLNCAFAECNRSCGGFGYLEKPWSSRSCKQRGKNYPLDYKPWKWGHKCPF